MKVLDRTLLRVQQRRVQQFIDLPSTTITTAIICPDFHRCYNGAPCVENTNNEGSYYCDCLAIVDNDIYAGLSCEHVATSYCNDNGMVDPISFCTNDGTCQRMVDYDHDPNAIQDHAGCDCLDGYKGDHCEYIDDQSIPNDFFSNEDLGNAIKNAVSDNDDEDKKSGFALPIILVLLVVAALGTSFWLVRRRRKRFHENHTSGSTVHNVSETHLEADGAIIYTSNTTPTMMTTTMANEQGGSNQNAEKEQDDTTEWSQVI